MPLLFAVTLFLSASLLFMVQPMVGKMILPLLGGSPAVWNACMVFFQALLLLGYLYAHALTSRAQPKKQWAVHTIVLLVPIAVMALAVFLSTRNTPIAVAEGLAPSGDTSPFLAVMGLLAIAIGIPFFVASTSAPLLQKWFAYTGHPSARDPYFLYAASNAGSLISLLGYPLVIEPYLTIVGQAWFWAIGFAILIGFIFVCGKAAANPIGIPSVPEKIGAGGEAHVPPRSTTGPIPEVEPPPSTLRILKWIALAFVPSSLMLGVTFIMTTDIASIPLLWVIPLALYLVTFIIAFGRVPNWFRLVVGNLAPVMILLLVFLVAAENFLNSVPTSVELALYIATFFAVALMCHYELARDRPSTEHLTGYFLWMSVGGVLGGLFNALIAPLIFSQAYEFYVTLVVGCFLVPKLIGGDDTAATRPGSFQDRFRDMDRKQRIALILDFAIPLALGLVFWTFTLLPEKVWFRELVKSIAGALSLKNGDTVMAILVYAVPVMACFFFVDRPLRFGLCVAVLLGVHLYRDRKNDDIIYTDRSFFGILKVEQRGRETRLVHGTTLHGTQIQGRHWADQFQVLPMFTPWDPLVVAATQQLWDPANQPLTYYHKTGPVGAMFHELRTRKGGADRLAPFAMVGLGTGSVSCYALPGQSLTFYEIDPAVRKIVETPWMVMNPEAVERGDPPIMGPFTFVDDAKNRGATVNFRMGDARLELKKDVDSKYALLLVDAFSSDAIPVHLLTKQAVEMYMHRITDDGLLALHISNKYVALEPVVAKIADDLKLAARVWNDNSEGYPGKTASSWVVLAKDEATLGSLAAPTNEQVLAFGTKNPVLSHLLRKYGPDRLVKDALAKEYGSEELPLEEFAKRHGNQAAILMEYSQQAEFQQKKDKDREPLTLGDLTLIVFGPMFRPLKLHPEVALWTDDYSDVLQVMMLKEVQWLRKQFGLPTPTLDDDE